MAEDQARWRTVATIAFIAVLLIPVFRDGDGVPLSSYPMYARPRSSSIEFIVPVGLDDAGNERRLSTETIAATTDPLIAETFLRDEVRSGRARQLCSHIALRVRDSTVTSVEIRQEKLEVVAHSLGRPSLIDSRLLASCPVP